jgi:nucleoid-associated protein YgaU
MEPKIMTRETRIGLLVGLGFIIMFGLVLTELTGTGNSSPLPSSLKDDSAILAKVTPASDVSPAVINPLGSPPRLGPPTPAGGTPLAASAPQSAAPAQPPEEPQVVAVVQRTADAPLPAAAPAQPSAGAAGPPEPPKVTPAADVSPVAQAAPARTYTVQPKDTLIKIARKMYGPDQENEYKRILEANKDKIKDPAVLTAGQELTIPELAAAKPAKAGVSQVDLDQLAKTLGPGGASPDKSQPAPAKADKASPPAGKTVYVVQRGDTLSKIARKTLKDDSRASIMKIIEANKDKLSHPDVLPVGLELEIPG